MDLDATFRTRSRIQCPKPRAPMDAASSDADLVVGITEGHERALELLYRRHGGASYALARRLLWDAAAAEEVVQDVFVRLWTEPDRFDPDRGALRSLLLMWTHRAAIDLLRRNDARRRRELQHEAMANARASSVDDEVIDLRLAEYVDETLAFLRSEHRTVIELAYLDGLTYREVALYLRRPEGTVKTWIRGALRELRSVQGPPDHSNGVHQGGRDT
jgi:RNA polymerase sigma-70 factor (ECF subfamily)